MRKGFMYTVEILVVAMTTLMVMIQLYQIPKQQGEWRNTELYAKSNEMLSVLDKKGVDWLNSSQVEGSVREISSNTVFGLKAKNAIKPDINVSCICNDTEFGQLKGALTPFEINGHEVKFNLTRIPPSLISFPHDQDAIVVFDYKLTNNYTQIRQFLGADRGIVEFRHLDQSEIDTVQRDFFGLDWNSTLNPNTNSVAFLSDDSSETYYNLYKYFYSIPVFQDNFSSVSADWLVQSGVWSSSAGTYQGNSAAEGVSYYNMQLQQKYSVRTVFKFDTAQAIKIIVYRLDSDDYSGVKLDRSSNTVTVFENVSGISSTKNSNSYTFSTTPWYDVKINTLENGGLGVYINNSLVISGSQPVTLRQNSYIGFGVEGGQAKFDSVRVTFSDNHIFSNLLQNEKVQPGAMQNSRTILLQEGTGVPACIVNSRIVDDKGRAAWLASGSGFTQEINSTLRALVAWAAGSEYEVIRSNLENLPVKASLYKVYDQDMFQPVEIELAIGYLY